MSMTGMNGAAGQKQFAVVTGGSSGIGLALAHQFAQNGFDLLIAAEDELGLRNAAEELTAAGARVKTCTVDLANDEGVDTLYQRIQTSGRPVDAIVINAGVGVGGEFRETDLDAELNLMRLNVVSTVHLAKHIVRDMVSRGSGRILFTASVASVAPSPYEAVYGASKAFVLSFSEAIRHELKDTGVTVTALMPGPTETNFFHRADMDDTKVGADKKDDPNEVARQGFEALMAGKDRIIAASVKSKLMGILGDLTPDPLAAAQHGAMSKPGSAQPR